MSGRVVHFEIPFADGDRAKGFYAEVFGWTYGQEQASYNEAITGPSDQDGPTEPGFVNGGLLRRESPSDGPIVVIDVDDIDATLDRVTALGGSVVLPRRRAGNIGWAAYFKDVDGNILGLWQRN